MKKNLILSTVYGYSYDKIRPFIRSIKKTGYSGDLVLFWNNVSTDTLCELSDQGVILKEFYYRGSGSLNSWSRFWPLLAPALQVLKSKNIRRKVLKIISQLMYLRFFMYNDYINDNKNKYNNVLITDIRDVVFQKDPFDEFHKGLMVFEEDGNLPLGMEKLYNSMWIEELFGKNELSEVAEFPILCAGTTMGNTDSIIHYLNKFEELIYNSKRIDIFGSDQGIHNYLCRMIIKSLCEISKNGEGPVLTMGPSLKEGVDFLISERGQVINLSSKVIPLLHQYDRHSVLAKKILGSILNE